MTLSPVKTAYNHLSKHLFENNKIILYYLLIFQKKSGKPRAEVIAIGEPPTPATDSFSTPVRFRPCRPLEDDSDDILRELLSQRHQQESIIKKLDIANQRIVALESLVRKGNNTTDALMDFAREFPTGRRLSEPGEEDAPAIDPSGIPEEENSENDPCRVQ